MVSDPTSFKLTALSDLTVSFFLPNPTGPVTEHQLGNATSYHVTGNVVSSASLESPTSATSWYYLNGVDTLAAADAGKRSIVPGGPHVRASFVPARMMPPAVTLPITKWLLKP